MTPFSGRVIAAEACGLYQWPFLCSRRVRIRARDVEGPASAEPPFSSVSALRPWPWLQYAEEGYMRLRAQFGGGIAAKREDHHLLWSMARWRGSLLRSANVGSPDRTRRQVLATVYSDIRETGMVLWYALVASRPPSAGAPRARVGLWYLAGRRYHDAGEEA